MGGVQQPGVIRLGEALALLVGPAAVHAVDQPGPAAGPDGDQRGPATPFCCCRRSPAPPGSVPAGPRYGPWPASGPGRIRLRRPARRPGPLPSFYHRPRLLPPPGNRRLVPLGGPPGRHLHALPDPVQQHIHPRQRVLHPEPLPHLLSDTGQRPALVLIAAGRRACLQPPHPARPTAPGTACTSPCRRPWRPAPPGRPRPAPAATGSPTSATPGTASLSRDRWPRPRSSRRQPAALVPGEPAPPRSARRHRDTSCLRHSAPRAG